MGYMTCLLARRTPKAKGDCVPSSATTGTPSGTVKVIRQPLENSRARTGLIQADMALVTFREAIDLVIQSRNKLGGDEDYVGKLQGHSATSINPERPQYLFLTRKSASMKNSVPPTEPRSESTSSGLISVLRVRQSLQNILTILKAYDSQFLKGIGLNHDQDSVGAPGVVRHPNC
jgi:hypothetical protein